MKNTLKIVSLFAAILLTGCSTLHTSDLASLQGKWKGHESGRQTEGFCYLTISGNNLEYRGVSDNDWGKATFTLKEDTNPPQLVGTITDCPDSQYIGAILHLIYRNEGGRLTITANAPGDPAVPAGFDAGTRRFEFTKN